MGRWWTSEGVVENGCVPRNSSLFWNFLCFSFWSYPFVNVSDESHGFTLLNQIDGVRVCVK